MYRIRTGAVLRSQLDETQKILYVLPDGNIIEGVLLRYPHADALCVSTQVGCRMNCMFCASALEGKVRDLTPEEMLGQIREANRLLQVQDSSRAVRNVVLMGSGEPFDNYDNVVEFLRRANDPDGLNVSFHDISLSTCGLVNRIYDFVEERLPVTLCLSLHAPNDTIRRKIMPAANAFSIQEILAACCYYSDETGRRTVFEYALIQDLNSDVCHAEELAGRLAGLRCHVNLIPLNDVKEKRLKAPSPDAVRAFAEQLRMEGISVAVRRRLGADIDGACGQLRRQFIAENTVPGTCRPDTVPGLS